MFELSFRAPIDFLEVQADFATRAEVLILKEVLSLKIDGINVGLGDRETSAFCWDKNLHLPLKLDLTLTALFSKLRKHILYVFLKTFC